MARVTVLVAGGNEVEKDASTVGELKRLIGGNFQATVNGQPASDSHALNNFDVVTLTEQVKGAA